MHYTFMKNPEKKSSSTDFYLRVQRTQLGQSVRTAGMQTKGKDHDKECPLTKVQKFSKCIFGNIFSQRLTTSRYMQNQLQSINFKRDKYCG